MDKISIIIPVYRTEAYIADCINSIISQTYHNYEVLLIDNNSDDNSIFIAEELLIKNNIDYRCIVETKQGQNNAKNRGIKESKGDWLVFVDSDDILSKKYLERLLECVKKTQCDVGFCDFSFDKVKIDWDGNGKNNSYIKYSKNDISKLFLKRKKILIIPCMIIKKFFFEMYPFAYNNSNMRQGEDLWQLWIILSRQSQIGYSSTKAYYYRVREQSTTTKIDYNRVMTCHTGFELLKSLCKDEYKTRFISKIIARQDFGLIRSSAQYGSYQEFKKVEKSLFKRNTSIHLLFFPDIRVTILTIILILSPHFFYKINHENV